MIEIALAPMDSSEPPTFQRPVIAPGAGPGEMHAALEGAIDQARLLAHQPGWQMVAALVDGVPVARFLQRHPFGGDCPACADQPWSTPGSQSGGY